MNQQDNEKPSSTSEEEVYEYLQRQPQIMLKLQENSLTVAQSLRDNYFKNTAKFITHLRRAMREADLGRRPDQILTTQAIDNINWAGVQGEVVTFLDGGFGQVQLSSQTPILLRVGSYRVKTGERRLSEREQFGYYPVIIGDLEGGSKERKDFPDIVRITAELLGGLAVLERTPDIRVLMFHGPLVYLMNLYAGHAPFTEKDIDIFLQQYAQNPELAQQLKEDFLQEAQFDIYPKMVPERCDEWIQKRWFEPLSWMAFLYRRLIQEARRRNPIPIIAGVVERSYLREFIQLFLLERVFRGLRKNEKVNYFNDLFGRTDLRSPKALLDKLGYTDSLLLAMLLETGQFSEPWTIDKYGGLTKVEMSIPGDPIKADFNHLKPPNQTGFPQVRGCYVHVSETRD